TGVSIGDPVLGFAPGGAASHVITDERLVAPMPRSISFEEAAAIPVAFVLAWHLLRDVAGLGPGMSILIHGAAGAVGQAAVQVARSLGARVFATASPSKRSV